MLLFYRAKTLKWFDLLTNFQSNFTKKNENLTQIMEFPLRRQDKMDKMEQLFIDLGLFSTAELARCTPSVRTKNLSPIFYSTDLSLGL